MLGTTALNAAQHWRFDQ